jgi:hypothetical protein
MTDPDLTLETLAEWHDRVAAIERDDDIAAFHRHAARYLRDVDAKLESLNIGPDLRLSIGPNADDEDLSR